MPQILYNVTVIIDHAVHEEWLDWMKSQHIPAVMNTDQFVSSKICKIIEENNDDGVTYAIQYIAESIDNYNYYQEKFALELQQQTQAKFGGKFGAFRTVMEIVD